MGWRYILVNYTRKVIEEVSLYGIWTLMTYLIESRGWEKTDEVQMLFEENDWTQIRHLVVNEGYKSHYDPSDFE